MNTEKKFVFSSKRAACYFSVHTFTLNPITFMHESKQSCNKVSLFPCQKRSDTNVYTLIQWWHRNVRSYCSDKQKTYTVEFKCTNNNNSGDYSRTEWCTRNDAQYTKFL